jgi:ornithine cyclodeaminase/alanine dehydrogenase-like protein (mu-crystallin family)
VCAHLKGRLDYFSHSFLYVTRTLIRNKLGELVNGKPGREGDELIVVDLTGTGAQDAAIGQVAWDKLSVL